MNTKEARSKEGIDEIIKGAFPTSSSLLSAHILRLDSMSRGKKKKKGKKKTEHWSVYINVPVSLLCRHDFLFFFFFIFVFRFGELLFLESRIILSKKNKKKVKRMKNKKMGKQQI